MKYDKYSVLGAYLLVATICAVIEVKAGDRIESPIPRGDHHDDATLQTTVMEVSEEEGEFVTKLYEQMLTPLSYKTIRSFERNVNWVARKVYEQENDDNFQFHSELDGLGIAKGNKEDNYGRQAPQLGINADLEF